MVKVEFFGLYRLAYQITHIDLDVDNILDLFEKLHEFNDAYTAKELKNSIVLVNGTNIMDLKKYRTKLVDGDNVIIMSPASGG